MSTQAGTIEVASRRTGLVLWGAIVSVLAAAALIMSAVALTQAQRTSSRDVAIVGAPLWDADKLEAMQGRTLAESVGVEGTPMLWDAGKLEAMRGRAIAG
jgi:hypothetical protein